jgi:hypothetical protein
LLLAGPLAALPQPAEPKATDGVSLDEQFARDVDSFIAARNWTALTALFDKDLVLVVGLVSEERQQRWSREELLQSYRRVAGKDGYRRFRRVCSSRRLANNRVEVTSAVVEWSQADAQIKVVHSLETLEIDGRFSGRVAVSGAFLVQAIDSADDVAGAEQLTEGGLELLCRAVSKSAG